MGDPAGSGPIVGAVQWLQGTLLGTVATVVAVIVIAIVGFKMLTGRMNWRYGAASPASSPPRGSTFEALSDLDRDPMFVALTRSQMFAGVTTATSPPTP